VGLGLRLQQLWLFFSNKVVIEWISVLFSLFSAVSECWSNPVSMRLQLFFPVALNIVRFTQYPHLTSFPHRDIASASPVFPGALKLEDKLEFISGRQSILQLSNLLLPLNQSRVTCSCHTVIPPAAL
jgi:hypothetical protein